ncbi:MAG: inositol monophosphatase [Candidatus Dependentiae bacterium]|nr:inositol monophosphatase [Candidatus Dependentiae bacterium]
MNDMQYFDQLQDVMIRSGQLVMQGFCNDFTIFEKQGNSLFTSIDLENEQFLKQEFSKIFPQAGFCAEESGLSGERSDWIWVIDPIDGTKNFIKGIPHFCIMVALTYKDDPMVAAIYQPITKELYYAEKGKGLWLNGIHRIEFADRLMQEKAALVVCDEADLQQVSLQLKENKIQVSRRHFGSAGIDAIYLAIGNIDFVIFRNIAWWDVAAGMLLIHEAGGLVCHYEKSHEKTGFGTLKAGNKLFFI